MAPLARWMQRVSLLIGGAIALMMALWIVDDPDAALDTDWLAFDNTADRLFADERVYRPFDAEDEPYPYLYPPWALWLTLPLRALGFTGSWALSAGITAAAAIGAVIAIRRSRPDDADLGAAATACIASGAVISATLIGQYSGLFAVSIAGAAVLWQRGREDLAGLALALLLLKPNFAVAVPVVLLWSRSWRACRGFGAGLVALLVLSVPFGLGRWGDFVESARNMAELQRDGRVPSHKMISVLGAAEETLGLDASGLGLWFLWLAGAVVTGVAVLRLWTRPLLAEAPFLAFGALALFIVAANPRVYFYDAVVVGVGALLVFADRAHVPTDRHRRVIIGLSILLWVTSWGGIVNGLNAFVGPLAAALLITVAVGVERPETSAENPAASAVFVP